MVIVGIISIVAITTYNSNINSANQSDAQQSLNAVALDTTAFYEIHTAWPSLAQLPDVEASYTYVAPTTASTTDETISAGTDASTGEFDFAAYDSSTSTCFFLALPAPNTTTTIPELQISSTRYPCEAASIQLNGLSESSGTTW